MRMGRWFVVLAAALTVLVTGCAAVSVTRTAPAGPVRGPYTGAWELAAPDFGAGVREVKMISAHRFSWTTFNDATHELLAAGGGRCAMAGGRYVETLEYSMGSTAGLVGHPLRFELVVHGDTLLQRGVADGGLPDLREVWHRAH